MTLREDIRYVTDSLLRSAGLTSGADPEVYAEMLDNLADAIVRIIEASR